MNIVCYIKNVIYKSALRQARHEVEKKNREHRVKLQEASKKLITLREELSKKEDELIQKENDLDEREKTLHETVTNNLKSSLADIVEKKRSLEEELKRMEQEFPNYKRALYNTDATLSNWIERLEKREISACSEILSESKKVERYEEDARKRGFKFEHSFADILKLNGFYDVTVTQASGDFGGDILAKKDDLLYVIQCKSYSNAVGINAVQEAIGAKIHYGTHIAVVATNNIFTKSAKILARDSKVVLWDCEKILQMEQNAE